MSSHVLVLERGRECKNCVVFDKGLLSLRHCAVLLFVAMLIIQPYSAMMYSVCVAHEWGVLDGFHNKFSTEYTFLAFK